MTIMARMLAYHIAVVGLAAALHAQAPELLEVRGLAASESAQVIAQLAPDPRASSEAWIHPRIVHALTGAPLSGVLVELFTEDGAEPTRLALPVASGTSGRDGGVRLPVARNYLRAEKARLSSAGFESVELSISELWNEEFSLFPARSLEGRVLDLDGLPIAGASLRSRQTCMHAVPAVETVTDAWGRFRFDSLPELHRWADLEVTAPGYGPVASVGLSDLEKERAYYGSVELRLPRRAGLFMRLMDSDGKPMPGRRVVTLDRPMRTAWTSSDGSAYLPAGLGDRASSLVVWDPLGELSLQPTYAARGRVIPLHPSRETPRGQLPTDSRVRITLQETATPDPNLGEIPVAVVCEDGTTAFGPGDHQLPRGRAFAVCGLDFSGWREDVRDFEIGAQGTGLDFSPRAEPSLAVTLPAGATGWLHVQVLDDSRTIECQSSDGPTVVHVPQGTPITLWFDSIGQWRRAVLPPLEADSQVDLSQEIYFVGRPRLPISRAPLGSVAFEVKDSSGLPIQDVTVEFITVTDDPRFAATASDGSIEFSAPRRTRWVAQFQRDGFTSVHAAGFGPAGVPAQHVPVNMPRLARLTLAGNISSVRLAGSMVESLAGVWRADVAAGSCVVQVDRPGAPPIALDLELAEGEERRIEIP